MAVFKGTLAERQTEQRSNSGLSHNRGAPENADFAFVMASEASAIRAPTGKERDSETEGGNIWVDTAENFACSDSPEYFAEVAVTPG